ncbi:FecR family protein [Mariniphaga anaerophila]|uniref:FecR family protein n=1 Tax=Mariniphaga anaerophila TaxID=1484053 RepID=A0A1M4Y761_9BACT|nr:FecR family protein [Mariniphaga anaerophila]SHF01601.1 FecR family protein [Mariniphaga anaerophila]
MNKTNQDRIWELGVANIYNEAGKEEKEELKLLSENADNEKVKESIAGIREKLGNTGSLQNSSSLLSWEKISQHLRKKQIKLHLTLLKYAAIIIFAFGVGILFQKYWSFKPTTSPVYTEVRVPFGQMSEITLYDGTRVWLNSGTTLRYSDSFGTSDRKVELIGEAFFKVMKSEIPFRVKIKNNEIEVLGTSFAAIAYPDEIFSQVTLVEGSVQINDRQGRALTHLKPKQQVNLPDDVKKKITTTEVNTAFYESWINGEIKFDNEKLVDVARRMERWYNVEIFFESEEVSAVRFTGTVLKNKPIDQSMKAICMLLSINAEYQNNLNTKDVITISK